MNPRLKFILQTWWNEPRHFFGGLALLSILGLAIEYGIFVICPPYNSAEWLEKAAVIIGAILLLSFALGFACLLLAWIPLFRQRVGRLLQRRFFVLACLVTLVALFYAEENWRGKRAWDSYRQEWEAKGERFDFASLVPPPVPDEQNFALAPIVASSYGAWLDGAGHRRAHYDTNVVNRLALKMDREGVDHSVPPPFESWEQGLFEDLKSWQEYYRQPRADSRKPNHLAANEFPDSPQRPPPAADVLLALSKYDSAINELRVAAPRTYSRFPLEYDREDLARAVLPHLSTIKQVVQCLSLRALAELEAAQPEKALADVKLALRCCDAVRDEPFLMSQLVRISCQELLMQPIWQGLARHEWSHRQIADLQAQLGKQDYLADYHRAMRGELAAKISALEFWRRHRDIRNLDICHNFFVVSPTENPELAVTAWFLLAPDGWFHWTELSFAQMFQHWNFPAVDLPQRLVLPHANARLAEGSRREMRKSSVFNPLVRLFYPSLELLNRRFVVIQSGLDLARVACALERYRLAQGQYPDALAFLSPGLIEQVPHDLINGKPFHYRRREDGQFVLYSVGWNEKDGGGEIVLNPKTGKVDRDRGDWVWKYPSQ